MELDDGWDTALRLRQLRKWRGKSLIVVAGLAGISESYPLTAGAWRAPTEQPSAYRKSG